jgi:hypothetical protein
MVHCPVFRNYLAIPVSSPYLKLRFFIFGLFLLEFDCLFASSPFAIEQNPNLVARICLYLGTNSNETTKFPNQTRKFLLAQQRQVVFRCVCWFKSESA